MKTMKIVLWGQEDLLSSFVELYLTAQKGWNVVNISIEQNLEILIQAIDKLNPDVVIIQQGDRTCHSTVPAVLLQNHPWLKVITLNLNNNLMEVYSKQNVLIKSADDLISMVEANSVP